MNQLMWTEVGKPCPACEQAVSPDAQFCNHCGAAINPNAQRACPRCGAGNPAVSRFCASCGSSLVAAAGGATPPATAPTNPLGGIGKPPWGQLALGGLGGLLVGSLLGSGRGLFGGFGWGDRDGGGDRGWGGDGFGDGGSGDGGE